MKLEKLSSIFYHCDSCAFVFVDDVGDFLASISWNKSHFKAASFGNQEVSCLVLISMSVATNNNWLLPSRNETWNLETSKISFEPFEKQKIEKLTFLQMMASRKTVPPRIFLMVPFGDFHICLRLNSLTRASSGAIKEENQYLLLKPFFKMIKSP